MIAVTFAAVAASILPRIFALDCASILSKISATSCRLSVMVSKIEDANVPIVCLPNETVVKIEKEASQDTVIQ